MDQPAILDPRPDSSSLARLFAQLTLVASADAALVGLWALTEAWQSATDGRPFLFALLALSIGRRPPPQLLIAGLALLVSGAVAQWLIGQPPTALVFGAGVASLVLVIGFAIARIGPALWRRAVAVVFVLASLLLPFGQWQAAVADPSGPAVAVMSSVPLGVTAGPDGRRLMRALERRGPVTLLDTVPANGPVEAHLLMIQPRALRGEEMVALDGWVRRGGRAVVLDDPQFDWRGSGPLGAPDGPLPTSLLDPLMARWGVRLELPAGGSTRPATVALDGGSLTLPSPGFFTRLSPACTLLLDARAARCRVGAGEALMIADADWVDPARWADQPDARGALGEAIASGELRPVRRSGAALWWGLILLACGLAAAIVERVRNAGRTEEEHLG